MMESLSRNCCGAMGIFLLLQFLKFVSGQTACPDQISATGQCYWQDASTNYNYFSGLNTCQRRLSNYTMPVMTTVEDVEYLPILMQNIQSTWLAGFSYYTPRDNLGIQVYWPISGAVYSDAECNLKPPATLTRCIALFVDTNGGTANWDEPPTENPNNFLSCFQPLPALCESSSKPANVHLYLSSLTGKYYFILVGNFSFFSAYQQCAAANGQLSEFGQLPRGQCLETVIFDIIAGLHGEPGFYWLSMINLGTAKEESSDSDATFYFSDGSQLSKEIMDKLSVDTTMLQSAACSYLKTRTVDSTSKVRLVMDSSQRCDSNLITVLCQLSSTKCESPWVEFDSVCYLYHGVGMSFYQALAYCSSNGGKLVTFNSFDVLFKFGEESPVATLLQPFWLGGLSFGSTNNGGSTNFVNSSSTVSPTLATRAEHVSKRCIALAVSSTGCSASTSTSNSFVTQVQNSITSLSNDVGVITNTTLYPPLQSVLQSGDVASVQRLLPAVQQSFNTLYDNVKRRREDFLTNLTSFQNQANQRTDNTSKLIDSVNSQATTLLSAGMIGLVATQVANLNALLASTRESFRSQSQSMLSNVQALKDSLGSVQAIGGDTVDTLINSCGPFGDLVTSTYQTEDNQLQLVAALVPPFQSVVQDTINTQLQYVQRALQSASVVLSGFAAPLVNALQVMVTEADYLMQDTSNVVAYCNRYYNTINSNANSADASMASVMSAVQSLFSYYSNISALLQPRFAAFQNDYQSLVNVTVAQAALAQTQFAAVQVAVSAVNASVISQVLGQLSAVLDSRGLQLEVFDPLQTQFQSMVSQYNSLPLSVRTQAIEADAQIEQIQALFAAQNQSLSAVVALVQNISATLNSNLAASVASIQQLVAAAAAYQSQSGSTSTASATVTPADTQAAVNSRLTAGGEATLAQVQKTQVEDAGTEVAVGDPDPSVLKEEDGTAAVPAETADTSVSGSASCSVTSQFIDPPDDGSLSCLQRLQYVCEVPYGRGCPDSWVSNAARTYCYLLIQSAATWFDAASTCYGKSTGANLLSNGNINDGLTSVFSSSAAFQNLYLWTAVINNGAASDVDTTSSGNTFYWTDGSAMSSDFYENLIKSSGLETIDFRQTACAAMSPMTYTFEANWVVDSSSPPCLTSLTNLMCGKYKRMHKTRTSSMVRSSVFRPIPSSFRLRMTV